MINYLFIPEQKSTKFKKGNIPHNKGKKWSEWLDGRKKKKILKNLELGRINGNPNLAGANAIKIIGIKGGKFCPFDSSEDAQRKTGICARNIRSVCNKKRKTAGGVVWFFESDNEWTELINKNN
jgi:hypothetical protein